MVLIKALQRAKRFPTQVKLFAGDGIVGGPFGGAVWDGGVGVPDIRTSVTLRRSRPSSSNSLTWTRSDSGAPEVIRPFSVDVELRGGARARKPAGDSLGRDKFHTGAPEKAACRGRIFRKFFFLLFCDTEVASVLLDSPHPKVLRSICRPDRTIAALPNPAVAPDTSFSKGHSPPSPSSSASRACYGSTRRAAPVPIFPSRRGAVVRSEPRYSVFPDAPTLRRFGLVSH